MKIEVYGSGCAKCKQTKKIMEMAAKELGLEATVESVSDMAAMMAKGIASTPAIAVDGKIVSTGKAPSLEQAKKLLQP